MSDEHRVVPWRERLRRSASRAPREEFPPEEKYRRSRSVSPIAEGVHESSRGRERKRGSSASSSSHEKPPTRAEMYQAIHTSRQLVEARTLCTVHEKLVAVHESLEERIINRVQAEQKAKDKSNKWVDMALTVFLVAVVTLWFWATTKLSDGPLGQFRLYFV